MSLVVKPMEERLKNIKFFVIEDSNITREQCEQRFKLWQEKWFKQSKSEAKIVSIEKQVCWLVKYKLG